MTLVKWTNRIPVTDVFDDIDRVFNGMFNNTEIQTKWTPDFNIKESDKQFTLLADLPGLTKKDIEIDVSEGVLTISGERKSKEAKDGDVWLTIEQSSGKFNREFHLPENVDESTISAKFKNGVLTIELPKTEPVQPVVNRISIS